MFPYFPKTRHDHATLGHSDIINSSLIHTLITSHIRANIYRFIYLTCLSKHYQKHTHQSHIYIFIYIYIYIYIYTFTNQGHTITWTLNHPLVIILLGNSNNQSCVTYISTYYPPHQISTIHSEELHVMDHLSKFHLNWTVNELGNAVLRKLRKLEKQS